MATTSVRWDVWRDLYFAATLGCVDCFLGELEGIAWVPEEGKGDAWAVAARGWWALGRADEAERAWARARVVGGVEVDALVPFLVPDGAGLAARRAETQTDPGRAADTWCDAAALFLRSERPADARRALQEAERACPDHAEAAHWWRVLGTPESTRAASRALRATAVRRRAKIAFDELESLLPTRSNGWMSQERYGRRLLFEPSCPAPEGSGLARLLRAGVEPLLRRDEEWAELPERDPTVDLELALDRVRAVLQEGRTATEAGVLLWRAAEVAGDAEVLRKVGEHLVLYAAEHAPLLDLGTTVSERLAAPAWRAWFAAARGEPDAIDRARAVLRGDLGEALPWLLAVGALLRAGAHADVAAEVARAQADPGRAPWTHDLVWRKGVLRDVRIAGRVSLTCSGDPW